MNKFNSFFDNLFPLRPLFPFVQSVLPTVFDDSLSYLETLGKVVKALNDTESNVNTLEQAVRAFADDLALYENLTITPVEITYNSGSGAAYSASMTYADIVSALNEGHTVIMHVSGTTYDPDIEFYSAALNVGTNAGVKVLYWDSPVYTVDGDTVIYHAFINENNVPGVMRRVIGGANVLLVHYDTEQNTADKSFSDIVSAIEAEKPVVLIADNQVITDLKWSTDITAEEVETISDLYFHSAYVVAAPSGFNLHAVNYSLYSNDTWEKESYSFPNDTRVNSMIDAKLSQYEGTSAIARLEYNETTGAVTRRIGGVVTPMTGYYINTHYNISVAGIMPILDGYTPGQSGDATFSLYMPVNYAVENGADVARFYRVYDGNIELVTVPANSNIATKTVTPVGDSVNVKNFSAKGDGTTDDTAAIQSAIDYAQTNGIRDVYFPAGIYKVTAPLKVTVATGTTPATGKPMYYYGLGCRLRGESIGTTIISKVGTGTMTIPATDAYRGGETLDTVIYLGGTNGTGLFISDMTIENGSSAADAWCVYATRARVAIDRANIASNSHGIFCYGWTNTLQDVVASCTSKAIEMTNCTSSVLEKVWANGENPYTINASYSTLISCCGDGCTGSVFTLTGNVAMIGCGSESAGCDRYIDAPGAGTVITVENFFAWAFSSAGKSYFRASGGAVLSIDGVRISNNSSSVRGAYMLSAATAARFSLKNCNVYDNGGGTAYPTLTGGLPSGTQLALDFGTYHGRYSVDSNGNIVSEEIGIDAFFDITGGHYAEVWNFTNLYSAKEDGYTYNSGSNPTKSASSGYSVTNLVPAAMGDIIRTAGINLRGGDMTLSKLVFFDSTQTAIFATSIYNVTGQGSVDWGGSLDADGNLTYTINNNMATAIQNTAYICIATRTVNFGSDPAISVNEEIKTKIEYVSGSVTLKDGIKVLPPTENDEPASKGYVDGKGYLTLADLPIYNGGVT